MAWRRSGWPRSCSIRAESRSRSRRPSSRGQPRKYDMRRHVARLAAEPLAAGAAADGRRACCARSTPIPAGRRATCAAPPSSRSSSPAPGRRRRCRRSTGRSRLTAATPSPTPSSTRSRRPDGRAAGPSTTSCSRSSPACSAAISAPAAGATADAPAGRAGPGQRPRRRARRGELGNRISTVFVDLPVREHDLGARIRTISAQTSELKDSAAVRAGALMVGASGWAPPLVSGMLARAMGSVRAFNLVVSNIPGPQQPFYLSGVRMREVYPSCRSTRQSGPDRRDHQLRRPGLLRAARRPRPRSAAARPPPRAPRGARALERASVLAHAVRRVGGRDRPRARRRAGRARV